MKIGSQIQSSDHSFDRALADALDWCSAGEEVETVAARFPAQNLLPYLELAQRLSKLSCPESGAPWFHRSLQRVMQLRRH
jgi:hypothetical protein